MNERILVVDDTPTNIQAVASILRGAGYQLSAATDGKQALDLLLRVRPDLILLDVMMPGIDGFETCRRIKDFPAWRDIPVIFLTSKNEVADIVKGFEAGALDYVAKPFNAHELLARVNTHLSLARLNRENQRLLLNILPPRIAECLKQQQGVVAERFADASVLFADIVGFTPMSAQLSPVELVELLNNLFSVFDELAEIHSLEKIKTIGDAYMVAGGLPESRPGHLPAMADFALELQEAARQFNCPAGPLEMRVGIHVGKVVAGVIGIRKFIYDVWGDTVNLASRLESHGAAGRIHVSDTVYQRLRERYDFEPRGCINLKGRGEMKTYFLNGRLAS